LVSCIQEITQTAGAEEYIGSKGDEVRRKWSRLHNKELQDLYYSPNILGDQIETKMGGARDKFEGEEKCIQEYCRKTQRKDFTWKT
jgi:hypothetical protein